MTPSLTRYLAFTERSALLDAAEAVDAKPLPEQDETPTRKDSDDA